MVRAVLDTVILVRCLLNPRSVWGRLVFDLAPTYRLIVSAAVLDEVLEVLDRPKIARSFRFVAGMDKQQVLAFLADAQMVTVESTPAVSCDPNDDKFLATAKAARAAFRVTEDDDLLVLVEYEGTRIVDARTFLRLLEDTAPHDT